MKDGTALRKEIQLQPWLAADSHKLDVDGSVVKSLSVVRSGSIIANFEMVERATLSRPSRLGTRRRKRRQAVSALPKAGVSRSGAAGAPSLDTEKQLATTVQEWSAEQATEQELHRNQTQLKNQLNNTVHKIWQDHATSGNGKSNGSSSTIAKVSGLDIGRTAAKGLRLPVRSRLAAITAYALSAAITVRRKPASALKPCSTA